MSLCGCVRACARPHLDSKQMKKGQSLLVCNVSLSPPCPHIFTHKHSRGQTGSAWPPAPQQRKRCLLFDSVSAGLDKLNHLSTTLVLSPAVQQDVSTLPTMWLHFPWVLYTVCCALLCLISEQSHTVWLIFLKSGIMCKQRHRHTLRTAFILSGLILKLI